MYFIKNKSKFKKHMVEHRLIINYLNPIQENTYLYSTKFKLKLKFDYYVLWKFKKTMNSFGVFFFSSSSFAFISVQVNIQSQKDTKRNKPRLTVLIWLFLWCCAQDFCRLLISYVIAPKELNWLMSPCR